MIIISLGDNEKDKTAIFPNDIKTLISIFDWAGF